MAKKKGQPAAPKELTEQEQIDARARSAGAQPKRRGGPPPASRRTSGPSCEAAARLARAVQVAARPRSSRSARSASCCSCRLRRCSARRPTSSFEGFHPGADRPRAVSAGAGRRRPPAAGRRRIRQHDRRDAELQPRRRHRLRAAARASSGRSCSACMSSASLFNWLQGFMINRHHAADHSRLREDVENKMQLAAAGLLRQHEPRRAAQPRSRTTSTTSARPSRRCRRRHRGADGDGRALHDVLDLDWRLALIALDHAAADGDHAGRRHRRRSQGLFRKQWKTHRPRSTRSSKRPYTGHTLVKVFGRERRPSRCVPGRERAGLQRLVQGAVRLWPDVPAHDLRRQHRLRARAPLLGGLFVAAGAILVGDVQAFIQYSQQFTQNMSQLGQSGSMVISGAASAERVFELLDADDEEADTGTDAVERGAGRVDFQHVKFSYSADKPLIEDLSLVVEPGRRLRSSARPVPERPPL